MIPFKPDIALSCPISRVRTRCSVGRLCRCRGDPWPTRMAGGGAVATAVGPSLMRGLGTACPWVRHGAASVWRRAWERCPAHRAIGGSPDRGPATRVTATISATPRMACKASTTGPRDHCGSKAAISAVSASRRAVVSSTAWIQSCSTISAAPHARSAPSQPRRAGRSSPGRPDAGGSATAPPPRSHGPTPAGGGKPHSRRDRRSDRPTIAKAEHPALARQPIGQLRQGAGGVRYRPHEPHRATHTAVRNRKTLYCERPDRQT